MPLLLAPSHACDSDVHLAQTAFHDALEKAQRPQPKPNKCTEVRRSQCTSMIRLAARACVCARC